MVGLREECNDAIAELKSGRQYRMLTRRVIRKFRLVAVRWYNAFMGLVPFMVKYGLGMRMRRDSPPYSLVKNGSQVVQIGAPRDILRAGRSRGVYFSLFAGDVGKVIIIEPDPDSVKDLEATLEKHGLKNVILHQAAMWSRKGSITVFVDPAHPAANFTEGCLEYDKKIMSRYRARDIPADTLDSVLVEKGIQKLDLVSITTNGSEGEILEGMKGTISAGLPYICLGRAHDYEDTMKRLGYTMFSRDDRGTIFKQRDLPAT